MLKFRRSYAWELVTLFERATSKEGVIPYESYCRAHQQMVWSVPGHQRPLHGSGRGSALWLPRRQWRRQDHDDAHDPGSLSSRLRPDYLEWHTRARGRSSLLRLFAGGTWTLSQDEGRRAIAVPGPPLRSL